MGIISDAERQGGLCQMGGWQPTKMARRRYQKGNLRKRGKRNPVWELQWWIDCILPDNSIGRRRESGILGLVSEMTLRQARKAAEEVLRPINEGKALPHSILMLGEFVEQFFVPLAFPILKASTRKRYQSTLDLHILPAFGAKRLCDISTVDLQRFILHKFDNGLGWETCNHLRNLMSKIYSNAKKWRYFGGENPASGVELPEKLSVREKRALMPAQVALLLSHMREPVRTMVLIAVLTGLRVGEILALRWQDLDLEKGELRVEQAIYRGHFGTPKTKRSKRKLPLPTRAVVALRVLAQRTAASEGQALVFATRKGTAFSDTNLLLREIKPVARNIGLPWVSWHSFRRTHCTLFQLAGGSPKDAQAQLGHADIGTTLNLYTAVLPEHQRAAVEKLSALVTNGDEYLADAENGITQTGLLQ